ncbi:hypothetical protein QVD17_20479 [Tagetes erecta]|uniref:Uncharacterized protein n=1 Tax=Tagetes erecta TaxID=13708 RepID=A0AAD8NY66_TARER|nr:hypothetical protein QVD17_20479 [Tagetes erecta]
MSAVCRSHLQTSAKEDVDQTSVYKPTRSNAIFSLRSFIASSFHSIIISPRFFFIPVLDLLEVLIFYNVLFVMLV